MYKRTNARSEDPPPYEPYEVAARQPVGVPTVTDEMVTAYLTANDAYWKRADELPQKTGKWRPSPGLRHRRSRCPRHHQLQPRTTMKNIKPASRIMRTDFEFSTDSVYCRSASWLGFSKPDVKPGCWITYQMHEGADLQHGRVIGKATATEPDEGPTEFVMVAALGLDGDSVFMQWVRPQFIQRCVPGPNAKVFEFLCGEWDDPQAIVSQIDNGFPIPADWFATS